MNQFVIFLKNGQTLLFEGVAELEWGEEEVAFCYFEKSLQEKKQAKFYSRNIAGWSASPELIEEALK